MWEIHNTHFWTLLGVPRGMKTSHPPGPQPSDLQDRWFRSPHPTFAPMKQKNHPAFAPMKQKTVRSRRMEKKD